jgi:Flp pilus assembly protein TadB
LKGDEAEVEVDASARSPRTAAQALSELSESVNSLIRNQLRLARVEMRQEFKGIARDTALQVAGLPFLLLGYLFLMAAATAALALVVPLWAAFLIMAGAQILTGLCAILVGSFLMRRVHIGLPRTAEELRKSRSLAKSFGKAASKAEQPATTAPKPETALPPSDGPHQLH